MASPTKKLKVREFEWKRYPGSKGYGFIAHELQKIWPYAVAGKKDGTRINEEGKEELAYQGIDYGKLTTLLTTALQETIAKVEALEIEVAKFQSK